MDDGDDTIPGLPSLQEFTLPIADELRRSSDQPLLKLAQQVETAVTHVEARITEYTERVAMHERAEDSQLSRLESAITRLVEQQSKFQGDTERSINAQRVITLSLDEQRKLQQAQIDNGKAELTLLKQLVESVRVEIRGLRKDLSEQHLKAAAKLAYETNGNGNGK